MLNKSTTSLPNRFPLSRHTRPGVLRVVLQALSIWRERQDLKALDAHLLNDLGLTRSDVETETVRPVWDAPNRWMR
ncbi:MAG: DUF1127 domain-containing protein [Pseudomonadota bacterium]